MKRHLPFALIFAAIVVCICYSTYGQTRAINSLVKNLTVSKETFLTITNGSSLDAVKNILGIAARHEFTVLEKKTNYTLIDCRECPNGKVGDDNDIYLLFRDNILLKMMRPASFPELLERYPYEGTTATRAKPWEVGETPKLVRKTINAAALTQSEMVDYLKPYDGKGMEPMNILPAVALAAVLAGPVGWSNMHKNLKQLEKDYATNEVFLKLYDGCRASLGMSAEKVDALYGKPLRVLPMKNGQIARIYGDNRDFENFNPGEQFSCVAVVFNPHGNVTAIYSDGYFCDEWKNIEPAKFAWSTNMGDLILLQKELNAEQIRSSQPAGDLGTFSFSIETSDFTRARTIATNIISRNSLTINVISKIHGWGYEEWKNGKIVGEGFF